MTDLAVNATDQVENVTECVKGEVIGERQVNSISVLLTIIAACLFLAFVGRMVGELWNGEPSGRRSRLFIYGFCLSHLIITGWALECNMHGFKDSCESYLGDLAWTLTYMMILTLHLFTCFSFLTILRVMENPFAKKQSPISLTLNFGGLTTILCLILVPVAHFGKVANIYLVTQAILLVQILFIVFVLFVVGRKVLLLVNLVGTKMNGNTSFTASQVENMNRYRKWISILGISITIILVANIVLPFLGLDCEEISQSRLWLTVILPKLHEYASLIVVLGTVKRASYRGKITVSVLWSMTRQSEYKSIRRAARG